MTAPARQRVARVLDRVRAARPLASPPRADLPLTGVRFEEWRFVGELPMADGFREYEFTWSPRINPALGSAEAQARRMLAFALLRGWREPRLERRVVLEGDWTPEARR